MRRKMSINQLNISSSHNFKKKWHDIKEYTETRACYQSSTDTFHRLQRAIICASNPSTDTLTTVLLTCPNRFCAHGDRTSNDPSFSFIPMIADCPASMILHALIIIIEFHCLLPFSPNSIVNAHLICSCDTHWGLQYQMILDGIVSCPNQDQILRITLILLLIRTKTMVFDFPWR